MDSETLRFEAGQGLRILEDFVFGEVFDVDDPNGLAYCLVQSMVEFSTAWEDGEEERRRWSAADGLCLFGTENGATRIAAPVGREADEVVLLEIPDQVISAFEQHLDEDKVFALTVLLHVDWLDMMTSDERLLGHLLLAHRQEWAGLASGSFTDWGQLHRRVHRGGSPVR